MTGFLVRTVAKRAIRVGLEMTGAQITPQSFRAPLVSDHISLSAWLSEMRDAGSSDIRN